jgi:hypothetical protein
MVAAWIPAILHWRPAADWRIVAAKIDLSTIFEVPAPRRARWQWQNRKAGNQLRSGFAAAYIRNIVDSKNRFSFFRISIIIALYPGQNSPGRYQVAGIVIGCTKI